jgi:hypothetical protein
VLLALQKECRENKDDKGEDECKGLQDRPWARADEALGSVLWRCGLSRSGPKVEDKAQRNKQLKQFYVQNIRGGEGQWGAEKGWARREV